MFKSNFKNKIFMVYFGQNDPFFWSVILSKVSDGIKEKTK